jgi:hypothetical protein
MGLKKLASETVTLLNGLDIPATWWMTGYTEIARLVARHKMFFGSSRV